MSSTAKLFTASAAKSREYVISHPVPLIALPVSAGVLHRSVPVAAVVVEFAGGVGSWVARTYTATKGGGAFLNGKRIHVSDTETLQRSLLVSTQLSDASR